MTYLECFTIVMCCRSHRENCDVVDVADALSFVRLTYVNQVGIVE